MERLTYKQAYNKIIEAYFKDEIKPNDPQFCFCGTLCNNETGWFNVPRQSHLRSHGYKGKDFVKMEVALFSVFEEVNGLYNHIMLCENYEDKLFEGMCAALEVLKEIHRSRGEDVDGIKEPFTKRSLICSNAAG